jgi:hypothetical protein
MFLSVSDQVSYFTRMWSDMPTSLPSFEALYSDSEKLLREKYFDEFYARFESLKKELRREVNPSDSGKTVALIQQFMHRVYDFPGYMSDLVFSRDYLDVSRLFFSRAKSFDPALTEPEIHQALRNVWIMNGIQSLLQLPVELTPSIFAYSLLYPYSDNLLDDPVLSKSDKLLFSRRFEDRLKGKLPVPADHREDKISQLVGMIEQQYSRKKYPVVYDSLLAIHSAQTGSLNLQHSRDVLSGAEVVSLLFEKGGTSVLADGFLCAGKLTPPQQRFLFGYGIWLQLADDVQDLKEDAKEQVLTLFSASDNHFSACQALNRTFHFGRELAGTIDCFPSSVKHAFGRLMVHSIELMLKQSAGLNGDFFPDTFIQELEGYSPVHFNYLRKLHRNGSSRSAFISRLVEAEV